MKLFKVLFFTSLTFIFSAEASALNCFSGPYHVKDWNNSTFTAKTIESHITEKQMDSSDYVEIEIIECLKQPCAIGKAKVVRNPSWRMTPLPVTKAESINTWTVHPVQGQSHTYEIPVCAPAVNND